MTRRTVVSIVAAALAAAALAADPQETPKDVGLVERASTRLAQLDVTVSGPKGGISGLTAADFEVRLNHKLVPNLLIDDLCVAEPVARGAALPEAPAEAPADAKPPTVVGRPSVATYLLYFDMPHLTQSGRRGAIDAAREMLPKLLAGGQRAMIVVSAANLKTLVPLTSDVARLEAALAKMVDDNSTFDTYASLEESRMTDIILELDRSIDSALSLASRFASEERWKQEKELRRLSMVLGRLSELDSPKSVLYFADTMRQNAGEHYLSFFGGTVLTDANGKAPADALSVMADAAMGALPLDRVMNEASGLGIRFYTIEGQGMTGTESFIQSRSSPSGGGGGNPNRLGNSAPPGLNSQRTRDAQTTLGSLAAETGGRSFINGITPAKMASQILGDMSCVYLLSFDPKGFPQDEALTVSVEVKRPKVKSTTRGRLVIQSEATRLTGRVLSAFAAPTATGASDANIRVGVIPIAYKDGHFTARVQVAIAGSPVPHHHLGPRRVSRIEGDRLAGRLGAHPGLAPQYARHLRKGHGLRSGGLRSGRRRARDPNRLLVVEGSSRQLAEARRRAGEPQSDRRLSAKDRRFSEERSQPDPRGRCRRRGRGSSRRIPHRGDRARLSGQGPKEAPEGRAHAGG